MSGYSQNPLYKKLGLKEEFSINLINEPSNYTKLLNAPFQIATSNNSTNLDFIHYFCMDRTSFTKTLSELRNKIKDNGIIWISWPKKSSKILTDIDENVIRQEALELGLVDIKVCSVDDVWSGLKLVIRKENRQKKK